MSGPTAKDAPAEVSRRGFLGALAAGGVASVAMHDWVPVAAAAGTLWKPAFAVLLATAMISMLGFLQGNMLASARVPYALARDGLLPAPLARITATHRVPLTAVFAHGLIALALALSSLAGGAAADAFAIESKRRTNGRQDLADEHLLKEQRFYNSLCMIYGSNSAKYESIVTKGYLPKERAVRCENEYQRTSDSWRNLLQPWRKD